MKVNNEINYEQDIFNTNYGKACINKHSLLEEKTKDDKKIEGICNFSNQSKELNYFSIETEEKTIQNDFNEAYYNGFNTKKEFKSKIEEDSLNKAASEIQLRFHNLDQKCFKVEGGNNLGDLNKAATKIQANYCGFKTRKEFEAKAQDDLLNHAATEVQSIFHESDAMISEDNEKLVSDDLEEVATKIQANYCGFKIRKELTAKTQEDSLNDAATEIQSIFHKVNTKIPKDSEEPFPDDLEEAVTKLQAHYRGYKTRKEITSKKKEDLNNAATNTQSEFHKLNQNISEDDKKSISEDLNEAATKLQANFRGFRTRKQLAAKSKHDLFCELPKETLLIFNDKGLIISEEEEENVSDGKGEAATNLQANYRGFKTRKEITLKNQNDSLNEAATEIQSRFHQLNPNISEEAEENVLDDKEEAATKLQANYRGFKIRKEIKLKNQNDSLNEAATEIQSRFHQLNPNISEEAEENFSDDKEEAATKLQANYRGFKTRKEITSTNPNHSLNEAATEIQSRFHQLNPNISEEAEENVSDDKEEAATKLQANYRGFKTRKEIKLKNQNDSLNEAATEIQSIFHQLNPNISEEAEENVSDDKEEAATKLQANYRGFKTRKEITLKNQNDSLNEAATEIQSRFHQLNPNISEEAEENVSDDKEEAATKLQANYRGFKTRKEITLKNQNDSLNEAATEIQSRFHQLNPNISEEAEENVLYDKEEAATKLQANYRGFKTRKEITLKNQNDSLNEAATEIQSRFHQLNPNISEEAEENVSDDKEEAATKLQANYRGGRRKFSDDKEEAATKLQANYRGFKTRKEITLKNQNDSLNEAATEIQSRFHQLNPNISEEAEENVLDDKEEAATKLQANYRGFKTRKEIKLKNQNDSLNEAATEIQSRFHQLNTNISEEAEENVSDDKEEAATKLQANYRGFKTRKEIKLKNQNDSLNEAATEIQSIFHQLNPNISEEAEENVSDDKEEAATKLQANYRGFKTRKEIKLKNQNDSINEATKEIQSRLHQRNTNISEEAEENVSYDKEEAATKLQANYRGFKTRKEITLKNQNDSLNEAATEIQSRLHQLNRIISEEAEGNVSDDKEEAATKLQANYRGFKTRKEIKAKPKEDLLNNTTEIKSRFHDVNQNISEDENVTVLNEAATKLQASYHGFKIRKEFATKNPEHLIKESVKEIKSGFYEDDRELIPNNFNEAATKLQTNYYEFKTRELLVPKIEQDLLNQAPIEKQLTLQDNKQIISENEGGKLSNDLNEVATRLQANYRGFKTRKELKGQNIDKSNKEPVTGLLSESHDKDNITYEEGNKNISDELNEVATKLQANYRGFKIRKQLAYKNQGYSVNELVSEIQSGSQDNYIITSEEDKEINEAATKIQANFRGFKTRKQLAEKSEHGLFSQVPIEIPLILNYKDITISEVMRKTSSDDLEEDVTELEAHYRGYKTKKEFSLKNQEDSLNEAATKTQSRFYELNPNILEDGKETISDDVEEVNQTISEGDNKTYSDDLEEVATRLQANYRGFKTRKELEAKTQEYSLNETREVQSRFHEVNQNISEGRNKTVSDYLNEAAIKIQSNYRGFRTRKELEAKTQDDSLNEAATKIQANYLGFKTRRELIANIDYGLLIKTVTKTKLACYDKDHRISEMEGVNVPDDLNKSATKLQANYRGFKARKELATKPREDSLDETTSEIQSEFLELNHKFTEDKEKTIPDDFNEAATKLQSNYRGFKIRKKCNYEIVEKKDSNIKCDGVGLTNRKASNFEDIATRNYQPKNCELNLSTQDNANHRLDEFFVDPIEPSIVNDNVNYLSDELLQNFYKIRAATVIQAIFRGYLIRKKLAFGFGSLNSKIPDQKLINEQELLKINNAASVIQAYFKGKKSHDDYIKKQGSTNDFDSMTKYKQNANKATCAKDKSDSFEDAEFVIDSSNLEDDSTEYSERNFESKNSPDIKPLEDNINLVNNNYDERQTSEKDAAIKIQSHFRGFKERKTFKRRKTFILQDSNHPLEESKVITDIGAVPFSNTKSSPQIDDVDGDLNAMNSVGGKLYPYRIRIFHYRESTESEKVLMYLCERGIEFSGYHMDLAENENYGDWFLKLNAKGEIPTMVFNETNIVSTAYNIIEFLESNIPVNSHPPPLIPCNTDPVLYPKYQEFIRKIGKIPLSIVSDGIAFHPEVSVLKPYNEPYFSKIRNDVRHLSTLLMEYASSVDDPSVQNALKSKADIHKSTLPRYTKIEEYKALLYSISLILDDIEKKFSLEPWVLGRKFSVADIYLGVLINRLILLGNPKQILSNRKKLPQFFRALKQRRPSFRKSVHRIAEDKLCASVFTGRSEKGKIKSENAVTWSSFWK
nr:abnormal spindle-like microcephaly-associated protein homolog [Lepeophtheirus salmonis]